MTAMFVRSCVLFLALATSPAGAQWHPAPTPGAAQQHLRLVAPELVAIVKAAPHARAALIDRFIARHVPQRLDALCRFRNPELRPLFVKLLKHDDWTALHRALFVLASMADTSIIPRAERLAKNHPHARVRELAAVTVRMLYLEPPHRQELRITRPDRLIMARTPAAKDLSLPDKPMAPAAGEHWITPTICWDAEGAKHAYGAGIYACADGVVTVADPGHTAVLHSLPGRIPVLAIYGNPGPRSMVAAGTRVEAGALLGTIGMGGLKFELRDAHGTKLDPVAFLKRWRTLTAPLLDPLRRLHPKLKRAAATARARQFGSAHHAARRVRDTTAPGSEASADAVLLLGLLEQAPARAVRRAVAMRDAGYPTEALRRLLDDVKRCRGVPRRNKLEALGDQWKHDAEFKKALEGDRRLLNALRIKDAARRREAIKKLAAEFGATCLAPRLR